MFFNELSESHPDTFPYDTEPYEQAQFAIRWIRKNKLENHPKILKIWEIKQWLNNK